MLMIPVWLLAAHFVGDFLCQTDWMALNKSKNWRALTAHVVSYSCVIAVAATWAFFFSPESLFKLPILTLVWFNVTFISHFVTDSVTSRITSRLWFFDLMEPIGGGPMWRVRPRFERRHWFFVVIGADQLIHYFTLALTWRWLAG